jgi:hypothetical protein
MRQSHDQTSVPHAESSRTLWRRARLRSVAAAELPSIDPGTGERGGHRVERPDVGAKKRAHQLGAVRSAAAFMHHEGPAGWRDTAARIPNKELDARGRG